MPVHRIKIGDIIVSSTRDLSWTSILELSQLIKKFATWDSKQKIWIINWRLFSQLSHALKFIEKVSHLDAIYGSHLSDIIEKIIASTPSIRINDSEIMILALDIDPFSIVKNEEYMDFHPRFKRETVNIEGLGNIEAPYISFKKTLLYKAIKQDKKLPSLLNDIVEKVGIQEITPVIKVRPLNTRKIIIEMPSDSPSMLINELLELGRIKIFYEDVSGKLSEKVFQLGYMKERIEEKIIILPSYAIGYVEEIFSRYDVKADIDYGISPQRIDYSIDKKFELMPYQADALKSWIQNNKKGTIVIPTGGGKTFIALAAIAELKVSTIIFVPNKWLLDQWISRISKLLGIPIGLIGVLGGGKKLIKPITVATYQSGYKYIDKLSDKFMFAIFDEAHHVPARTFKDIALNIRAIYRMALSATPERRDRNEILLFKLAGRIVYNISYRELILKGVVAPVVVRKIYVPLPPELRLIYSQYAQQAKNCLDDIKYRQIINKMIEIARDNPLKIQIIKQIVLKHANEKIFIFTGSIDFAERITKELQNLTSVALLTAKTRSTKEEKIIKGFQRGIIRCLVLIRKGEEGVDVGDASIAIIAGGSKQEREFIQRVGRVLRAREGKIARVYEIVTENSIEETLSKARKSHTLVRGIEKYIERKFGIPAYKKIIWRKSHSIE